MGRVADAFDALRVRVQSPDGRVWGELHSRRLLDFGFTDEDAYYAYASEQRLAEQATAVVRALFVGQQEGQVAVIRELTELTIDESPHWDASVRRFEAAKEAQAAAGLSRGDWVSVATTGMREFEVSIGDGALEELDDTEFLAELRGAVGDLQYDWGQRLQALKREHLGVQGITSLDAPPLPARR